VEGVVYVNIAGRRGLQGLKGAVYVSIMEQRKRNTTSAEGVQYVSMAGRRVFTRMEAAVYVSIEGKRGLRVWSSAICNM
jgi:hypothetical protein